MHGAKRPRRGSPPSGRRTPPDPGAARPTRPQSGMKAIRVEVTGGPEVLRLEEVAAPVAGAGHVVVKIAAAGVNFIDVYYRTGQYRVSLPFTPGQEAAGVVTAVGPGVTDVTVGDRVAYTNVRGAYAEYALVPADRVI